MQQYFFLEKKMKKLFAFVLDCNHHLICLVNQIRGRGEDRRRLSISEELLESIGKPLGVLDEFTLLLIQSLFTRCTRNVS